MQLDESKRIILLAIAAAFAATPLVWFSVDANAGDKLLRLTSPAPSVAAAAGAPKTQVRN
jgi:hypothetical protein